RASRKEKFQYMDFPLQRFAVKGIVVLVRKGIFGCRADKFQRALRFASAYKVEALTAHDVGTLDSSHDFRHGPNSKNQYDEGDTDICLFHVPSRFVALSFFFSA